MRRLIWGFADCWKSHVTARLYFSEASDAKSNVRLHDKFLVSCLPLIWFGKTSEIFWIQTICKLRERERERERERLALAYESLVISKHKYLCWKWYLEMLLVRIGFCTTKSDIRQYPSSARHRNTFKWHFAGPTLNAGLLVLRITGDLVQYC